MAIQINLPPERNTIYHQLDAAYVRIKDIRLNDGKIRIELEGYVDQTNGDLAREVRATTKLELTEEPTGPIVPMPQSIVREWRFEALLDDVSLTLSGALNTDSLKTACYTYLKTRPEMSGSVDIFEEGQE